MSIIDSTVERQAWLGEVGQMLYAVADLVHEVNSAAIPQGRLTVAQRDCLLEAAQQLDQVAAGLHAAARAVRGLK